MECCLNEENIEDNVTPRGRGMWDYDIDPLNFFEMIVNKWI